MKFSFLKQKLYPYRYNFCLVGVLDMKEVTVNEYKCPTDES